ncbi:MAG: acyl-CoA thioester hydrolase/BAAT C-terminal domain-containing protein [Rubrivivax sp.]
MPTTAASRRTTVSANPQPAGRFNTVLTGTTLSLALLAGAALLAAAPAQAQRFDVQPASAQLLAGAPVQLRLSGLPANSEVTLTATRLAREWSGALRPYRAQARFAVGADGALDLATQAPLAGGSYSGADLRGLFWSMQPVPPAAAPAPALAEGEVQLVASQGDKALVSQTLRVMDRLPGLQWRDAAGFPGAKLALPPGAVAGAKLPVVIALGGSEGGSATVLRSAAMLASHGFAVLGLPYYSPGGWSATGPTPPELPSLPGAFADIPVDRLEQARAWLQQQPELDAERLGVYGVSKGAEFALIAGTRLPWLKSVVAVVPTDVVWEGWGPGVAMGTRSSFSWKGQALPFVPYKGFAEEFAGFQSGAPVLLRRPHEAGRAAHADRVTAARIPVEQIAAPVMVVGGHDDQVWASGTMAEAIAKTRAAAGRETVALVYREAGHALSGTGWSPTTQYNAGPMKMGGQPAADARAQAEAFDGTLAFLKRTLAR